MDPGRANLGPYVPMWAHPTIVVQLASWPARKACRRRFAYRSLQSLPLAAYRYG